MPAIIIIEDKQEELRTAIATVKERFGAPGAEGTTVLGLGVEDIFSDKPWQFGFEVVRADLQIIYSNNLRGADEAMKFAQEGLAKILAKGEFFILTDLMFPLNKGGSEQANGVSVILDAVEAGIPVTVCSDTDHHEVKFLPKLCRHLEAKNPGAKINLVLDKKDWKKAVDLLIPHADPSLTACNK